MRIGIDAHFLERVACGNHTYTDSLLSAMAAADEQNDYILYHLSKNRPGLSLPFKRLQWRRIQPKLAPLRFIYGFPLSAVAGPAGCSAFPISYPVDETR